MMIVHKTHGKTDTKEYRIWNGMKNRCYCTNDESYPKYGSRGIKVCERWKNSFECFLEDMKECPKNKDSIDRINNDGDYSPENCRWATNEEQANNTSRTHYLEYNGEKLSIAMWSKKLNIPRHKIKSRIKKNLSISQILEVENKEINANSTSINPSSSD